MNIVIDVLQLRRVKLDYVSPPICQVLLSGSGSSIFLESIEGPAAPTSLVFGGQCARFLQWVASPETICLSLYVANDQTDPQTHYTLLSECLPQGYVNVCTPGWWRYSTMTPEGVESDFSNPIFVDGSARVNIPVVLPAGAVRFNVYKNPDPTTITGNYTLVLTSTADGAFEVCEPTGCYRLQAITNEGASELSQVVCRDLHTGCCPAQPCPATYIWSDTECSCVFDDFADILGPDASYCLGTPYASQLTAVGGVAPFLWELVSGSLPPGLTFHTGLFTGQTAPVNGTPTASGSYSFTARATSSSGTALERTFTISGSGVDQYPALPLGYTDTAYSEALTSSGGTAPFTFVLVSGALPSGFSLASSGLLSGTTGDSGTFDFSVQVTDSLGAVCVTDLSLVISECPPSPTYPVIATWGQLINQWSWGFDPAKQRVWVNTDEWHGIEYPPKIGIASTSGAAPAFIQYATDPGVRLAAYDWSNQSGWVSDTKYRQMFIFDNNARRVAQFSMDTYECTDFQDIFALWSVDSFGQQWSQTYSPSRGYLYVINREAETRYRVWAFNCDPAIGWSDPAKVVFDTNYIMSGIVGGGTISYCDFLDKLIVSNNSGVGAPMFYLVDPDTGAFLAGPITGGIVHRVQAVTGTRYAVFSNQSGGLQIVDLESMSTVGVSGSGDFDFSVANTCVTPNVLYISSNGGNIESYVLPSSPGDALPASVPVGLGGISQMLFDRKSGRMFGHSNGGAIYAF